VVDYCPKNNFYLALDEINQSGKFVIFDDSGDIKLQFNNSQAGPMAFSGQLNSLSFDNDCNGFYLLTQRGLYQYALDGTLISFTEDRNQGGRILPSDYHLIDLYGDNTEFLSLYKTPSLGYTFLEKEFYKTVKLFSLIKPTSGEFLESIGFEKSSDYLTNQRLFPPSFAFSDYDTKKNIIYIAHSGEKNVFKYQYLNNKIKFLEKTPLDLDYFTIEEENYQGVDLDAFQFALDSRIEGLLFSQERLLISYVKGMDHDEFLSKGLRYNGDENYRNFILKNYQYCLSILDSGKKSGKDIILPDTLSKPIIAFSKNEFLIGLNRFKVENKNEIFYKLKLNYYAKTN
jgi:hypothetical protein